MAPGQTGVPVTVTFMMGPNLQDISFKELEVFDFVMVPRPVTEEFTLLISEHAS